MDRLVSYQITKLSRYELVCGSVTELNLGSPACYQHNQSIDTSCSEGKYSVCLQCTKQGELVAHAQKTHTPLWFSGKGFKMQYLE